MIMKNFAKACTAILLAVLAACSGGSSNFYGQLNAPDGAVDGAEVLILDSATPPKVVDRVLSAASGKFGLKTKLTPGVYQVEIKKLGYQTLKKTFSFPETTSLTVSLVPQFALKGIVRLPDQSVAPKAILTFKKTGADKIKVISDEGGNYLAEGLDAGDYAIEVLTTDGLHALEIAKFTVGGANKVIEKEFVLEQAKGQIDKVGDDVQKSRVITGVDQPIQN